MVSKIIIVQLNKKIRKESATHTKRKERFEDLKWKKQKREDQT
jgi:hypothetical protein